MVERNEDGLWREYSKFKELHRSTGSKSPTDFSSFRGGFVAAEELLGSKICDWHGPCVHGYCGSLPNGHCDYRECECVQAKDKHTFPIPL